MKFRRTIIATAIALAALGASAANAVTLKTYDWSYVTTSTSLSDCQGYCSGYSYLADFHASGTLTVAAGQSPTDILGGSGTLSVAQLIVGGTPNINATFNLTEVVGNPSYPGTSTNTNWIWDNLLPLDSVGGPLFTDAAGDQFNIWGYNVGNNLLPPPKSGIPEVVTNAAAGFSLVGTGASQDFLDARGTFIISAVPEPASWAMFLLGFGAIGWTLRSRRALAAAA